MKSAVFLGIPFVLILYACATPPPPLGESREFFPFENSRLHQVDGYLLHYRVWTAASRSKGAAFLVHGLGGSTYSYRELAPALAASGYDVVAVDIPGFGYSSRGRIASFESERIVGMLWDLADHVGIGMDGGYSLIGHSMGSRTVIAMATQRPNHVDSLVLVNPAFDLGGPLRFVVRVPPGNWILMRYLERTVLTYDGIKQYLETAYGRRATDEEIRNHLEPLLIDGTVRSLGALVRTSGRFRYKDRMAAGPPAKKVLLLWGTDDPHIPVSEADAVLSELPGSRLRTIDGAHHCPVETHPNQSLEVILRFLDRS